MKSSQQGIGLKLCLIICLLGGFMPAIFAQSSGDYRSVASGNWNVLTNWERYNGSAWVTPTAGQSTPNTRSGVITIRNGHAITVTANVSADQIVIQSGAGVTINNGVTLTVADAAGTDFDLSGTLDVNGTILLKDNTTSNVQSGGIINNNNLVKVSNVNVALNFLSGSSYNHIRNGGAIPVATWHAASTCSITGVTSTMVTTTSLTQSFGNFTWNCPAQSADLNMAGKISTIQGNFTITNTGSSILYMSGTGAGTFTTNIAGALNINGGNLGLNISTGSSVLNVAGAWTMSSGSLIRGGGTGRINFSGSGTQTISKTGGTITGALPFTVNNGSTIDLGTSVLDGTNATFTAAAGSTIITSNDQGLSSSGATGSIQVGGTRTYHAAANYQFNGSNTGNFSTTSNQVNNLSFNRSSGVTLDRSFTVTGTLNLASGIVTTGVNSITMAASGSISNASASNYINGKLNWTFSGAATKTFPIGKGGAYRSIQFQYLTVTGTSIVGIEQFEATIPGTLPENTTSPVTRYWTVSETGGSGLSAKITLDIPETVPAGNAVMLQSDGTDMIAHNTTTPAYTNTTGLTDVNGMFTLGVDCRVTADAGSDLTGTGTCGLTSVTLDANTPAYGSGMWTIESGVGGSFSNASNPNASFSGTPGEAYLLRWTLTNGACADFSEINVVLNQKPTASIVNNSGTTEITCAAPSIEVTATGGDTYSWDNGLGTDAAASIILPGDYTVTVINNNGCEDVASISITQDINAPTAPGGIDGATDVCSFVNTNTPVTYSIEAVDGADSYEWTVPAGATIVSGQGSTAIQVLIDNSIAYTNNQFAVASVKTNGCKSAPSVLMVEKNVPAIPTEVFGPTNVCDYMGQNTTATYRIDPVPFAASYTWRISGRGMTLISGQGTTTIQVQFDTAFVTGSIKVTANSNCGTRAPRALSVTRKKPVSPIAIIGPTNACPYVGTPTVVTYRIDPALNATSYNWIVPANVQLLSGQGTTSITVTFDAGYETANFQVSSINTCGASGFRKLKVIRPKVSTPSPLDILPLSDCPSRQYQYSLTAMPANATTIQWSVPDGATIVSGQGTASVVVEYGSSSIQGYVRATALNECSTGGTRSLFVKLPQCAAGKMSTEGKGNIVAMPQPQSLGVLVYPNPTHHSFSIFLSTSKQEPVQVRIISLDGREIQRLSRMPDALKGIGADLPKGTYLVEITQADKREIQKLIKL